MADERNRWLDRAAAERLLRGEPAGPGADHPARARAERLRATLDELSGPAPHTGAELPGEAAALAAFRAARGTAPAAAPVRSDAFGAGEPVVELSPWHPAAAHASAPAAGSAAVSPAGGRRMRPVRFGLAAALASVAFGGLAAAAGAGLLDGPRHDTAGPAPAVSVSSGDSPAPDGAGPDPTLTPGFQPSSPRGGDGVSGTPGTGAAPGTGDRTTPGGGAVGGGGTGTEPSANGAATAGKDGGTKDRFLDGGTAAKDRENRLRAVTLCQDFRAGRLNDERREKLTRLANGLTRIPRYCESLLAGAADGATRSDAPGAPGADPGRTDQGGGVLRAPTLTPALPADGSLLLRARH
ncbi:hypothetical protein ACFWBF_18530 [Streptomyces sp. NPDC060028]|uniref:hypothetical protein n=1 Tax=Streptomyces sp. NPDC060028 TaxID=3347041 RepID=UPI0036A7640B